MKKKKKKSLNQLKEDLKKIQSKAPRTGVIYTKIVPDKTKYTRKIKHKNR